VQLCPINCVNDATEDEWLSAYRSQAGKFCRWLHKIITENKRIRPKFVTQKEKELL